MHFYAVAARTMAEALGEPVHRVGPRVARALGRLCEAHFAYQWICGGVGVNYHMLAEHYFVGNTPGGGIEYAPAYFPEDVSTAYVWGHDPAALHYDVSAIGFTPSPDGTGGQWNVQNVIKTFERRGQTFHPGDVIMHNDGRPTTRSPKEERWRAPTSASG